MYKYNFNYLTYFDAVFNITVVATNFKEAVEIFKSATRKQKRIIRVTRSPLHEI